MSALWAIITTRLGRALSVLVAVIAVLFGVYRAGTHAQERKQAKDDADDYINTRKRIDAVGAPTGDNPIAAARKRLRARQQRK